MAGRPRTRAREQQQALEQQLGALEALGGIPDAGASEPRTVAERPLRVPLRAVPPDPRHGQHSGPEARRVADSQVASDIALLTRSLHPGLRVTIERVKPHWCVGIVDEGYTLDSARLTDLLEHIREEWGGAAYRLAVMQPNGVIAFETRIAIAAPPRFQGKDIYRATWGGEGPPEPEPPKRRERERDENPRPAVGPNDVFGMVERVMGMVAQLNGGGNSDARYVEALREFQAQARAQNQELIQAVVTTRATEARAGSLVEQLREVVQAQAVIREAGEVLSPPTTAVHDAEEPDMLQGAVKEALGHFVGEVVRSKMGGSKGGPMLPGMGMPKPMQPARAPARASAPVRARENPQNNGQTMHIPDAGVAGQNRDS